MCLARLPTNASLASDVEAPERPDARAFLMSTAKKSLESAFDSCLAHARVLELSSMLYVSIPSKCFMGIPGTLEEDPSGRKSRSSKMEKSKDKKNKREKTKKKKKKKGSLSCSFHMTFIVHLGKLEVTAPLHPRSRPLKA